LKLNKPNSIHSASIEATRLTPTELGRTQTAQTLLNQPAIAGDVHLNNSRNQKATNILSLKQIDIYLNYIIQIDSFAV
jgi:hypothetical protein